MANICKFCGMNLSKKKFLADGTEISPEESNRYNHDCHCVHDNKIKIAWGICCAKFLVGEDLMHEEDFHDGAPWALPEDCSCKP